MPPEHVQFVGMFKEEAAEYIQALHRGLLGLKHQTKDKSVLQRAARAADTLLGSAMTLGLEEVSQHARTMRDRLFAARDGTVPLDAAAFDLLLQSLETLCIVVDAAVVQVQGDGGAGLSLATVMALRTWLEQLQAETLRLAENPSDPAIVHQAGPLAQMLQERSKKSGLDSLAQVAQRIDDLFRRAEQDGLSIDAEMLSLLLQGIGFMELLLDAAATGEASGVEVGELCALLDEVRSAAPKDGAGTAPAVSSLAPLGTGAGGSQETHAPAYETYEVPEPPPPDAGARKKIKVLIASNSTLFSRTLSEVIGQGPYEVVLASDANDVVSHLQEKDIDLCFIRDSLPRGLDICEQFSRGCEAGSTIPIIVYSPQSRMQNQALEKGAAGFLKVPCQPQDMLALVERLYRKKPSLP